jgi:hypothetical protein
MSDSFNILDDRRIERSWLEPFLFGSTLVAATVLYFATKEPMLAVLLPCLHGGWNTFRTGFWLLRTDPCRSRARTCFAFYIAAACWKAAAAALLAVLAFAAAEAITGVPPNMDEFAATMLVVAGGVTLNTLVGLAATCAAVVCKVRVWVHPHLRRKIGGDLRLVAGLKSYQRGFNYAIFVVGTALVFPVVSVAMLGIAALTIGKNPREVATFPTMIFEFAAILGGPIAMIPCYAWLSSRIIARSPQECWTAGTLDERNSKVY